MFDIYGVIDIDKKLALKGLKDPFLKYREYRDIPFCESCIQTDTAKFFWLERRDTSGNYFYSKPIHFFNFGIAFSNKRYESLTHEKPRKLSAEDLYTFYHRYKRNIVDYIKGSFVLFIFDEIKTELVCISDHLNVFPIFYACRDGIFVFSSAIKPILDSGLISKEIDKTAIVEYALFDYTLGSKTYYRNIRMLDYGILLRFNSKGIKEERYFTIDSLFQKSLISKEESLELLACLLYENVNLYSSDAKKFLISLTGGFDGRANLALTDRPKDDFLCFSYGMPSSRQITIPEEIASRLKVHYMPIYLDDGFEAQYEELANRALFYSDGTAPILRANYPYAYRELQKYSDTAVTGLFGSEILRPIHNLGIQFNDNSLRLFMGRSFDENLKNIFNHEKRRFYLQPMLFDECYDEIRDQVWKNYFEPFIDIDRLTRFFFFFIGEGIRKYFMQEIRIERVFVSTRFPYFDFDFVELTYKTPFAGIYNGALKESPLKRRRAQLLYAYVIDRHNPVLGEIITDRGYPPKALLSPFSYLRVTPGYLRAQLYKKRVGNDTFDSKRWTDLIFSSNKELMVKETDLFPGRLYSNYNKGENLIDNYYFSRIFSLKYWFEKMQNV